MRWVVTVAAVLIVGMSSLSAQAQEQMGDLDWRPSVTNPAYAADGPRILMDAAHGSAQTIDGRYAGFAALMRADGYRVEAGLQRFDAPGALDGVDVLVISNAAQPSDRRRDSAFDDAEMDALIAWIRQGGSLLLAADHAPHGTAAEALAARIGVAMGKGYAFQTTREGVTSNLDFEGAALGDHPIIAGRNSDERVGRVHTFTGQSLQGPEGSTVLLALDATAREAVDQRTLAQVRRRIEAGEPSVDVMTELSRPALPAQGLAFPFGEGRVVVLGEAGMLTAQILWFPDEPEPFRFGLNTEGHDDQQFALNTMHWLSRILP